MGIWISQHNHLPCFHKIGPLSKLLFGFLFHLIHGEFGFAE